MSAIRRKNVLLLFLFCFLWPTFLYFKLYRDIEPIDDKQDSSEINNQTIRQDLVDLQVGITKDLDRLYDDYSSATEEKKQSFLEQFFRVAQLQNDVMHDSAFGLKRYNIHGISDVANALADDERFIYIIDGMIGGSTARLYTLHISNSTVRLSRLSTSRDDFERKVRALRCGLDVREWNVNRSLCEGIYPGLPDNVSMEMLPFDAELSHSIFNDLFDDITIDTIVSQLHIVPNGPVVVLPFNILVTRVGDTLSDSQWFVDKFTHTINSSVDGFINFKRGEDKGHKARKKMRFLGIGNPNIEGDESSVFYSSNLKKAARMSRAFTSCTTGKILGFGNVGHFINDYHRDSEIEFNEEGIANADSIRRLTPLPESAYEICTVSERFKTIKKRMLLSKYARERIIKAMNEDGKLAEYDVIHIASHAIVDRSGKSSGTGIVLSPHDNPSLTDDGFLNSAEIAELSLDADWVILSACNTGTSEKNTMNLLGGLAEAFSRANVRSLMVTNWSVSSQAAMEITTRTVERFTNGMQTKQGALRETILELKQGSGTQSHPAYWGPFTLIGS